VAVDASALRLRLGSPTSGSGACTSLASALPSRGALGGAGVGWGLAPWQRWEGAAGVPTAEAPTLAPLGGSTAALTRGRGSGISAAFGLQGHPWAAQAWLGLGQPCSERAVGLETTRNPHQP